MVIVVAYRKSRRVAPLLLLLSGSLCTAVLHAQTVDPPPGVPSVANTRDPSADDTSELAEVVVNARRVAENIQQVPITVTTFTPQQLENIGGAGINIQTINWETPGIELCCNVWNAGLVYIRGVQTGASVGGVVSTPFYFADVPYTVTGYSNYFDMASVEILKGPQGTLFGQNALSGAFVYQPTKPGKTLDGFLSLSGGDYDRRSLSGAADIPLVDGHLYVRLAAEMAYRDGYIHDLSTNESYNNEDYYIIRPSAVWNITDRLENYTLFQYSYSQDNGQQNAWVLDDVNFNSAQPSAVRSVAAINGGSLPAYYALAAGALQFELQRGPYQLIGTNSGCPTTYPRPTQGAISINKLAAPGTACPFDWNKDWFVANTTTYTFNGTWNLKNIFGLDRSRSYATPSDGDGTPLLIFQSGNPKNNHSLDGPHRWSDELQVHGTTSIADLTAGLFAIRTYSNPGIVYGQSLATQTASATYAETDSHAVYANLDIHLDRLLHGLTFIVGGRYNNDYSEETSITYNPATNAVLGVPVQANQPSGHLSSSNFSYQFGLRYQVSPETMYFLTDSKGYSAGGFQGTPGIGTYEPQYLNQLEAGIKSTFNAGSVRFRTDASVFYGWFDNIQVNVWSSYNTPITDVLTVGFLTQNAAQAYISGVDGDFVIVPSNFFELGLGLSYLHDRYTQWTGPNPLTGVAFDYSSTPFVRAPTWKGNLRATFHLPTPPSIGRMSLIADFSARTYVVTIAEPEAPYNPANPETGLICKRQRTLANGYPAAVADGGTAWVDCTPGLTNLDLALVWDSVLRNENLSLGFHITNVTNNTYQESTVDLDSSFGISAYQPAPPRMYYATLDYRF